MTPRSTRLASAAILARADRARPLDEVVPNVGSFLDVTFGREPWLRPAGATGLPTFTLEDVDRLVESALLVRPFFRVVRDGVTLPPATYTRRVELSGGGASGVSEPGRVRELLQEGATLVLESAHRYVPSLARWCANLALDLELATQANVYITPPGGRGFAPHVDSHDVFVLQTQGKKCWTVRERSQTLPRPVREDRAELSSPATVDTPVLARWDLSPGAVAYLPRGFPHSAAAGEDEFSIHLTVGLLAPTTSDVVQAMSSRAAARRWSAETIAPRSLATPPQALDQVDLELADYRAVVARRVVRSLATPTTSGLRSLSSALGGCPQDASLSLAVDALVLEPGRDGGLVVVLADREMEFPAATAPTAHHVLTAAASAGGVPVARFEGDAARMAAALVESGVLVIDG